MIERQDLQRREQEFLASYAVRSIEAGGTHAIPRMSIPGG